MVPESTLLIPLSKNPFLMETPWNKDITCIIGSEHHVELLSDKAGLGIDETLIKRVRLSEVIVQSDLTLEEKKCLNHDTYMKIKSSQLKQPRFTSSGLVLEVKNAVQPSQDRSAGI
jgi:hypothetical protein